jgi:hypothetical protein
VPASLVRPASVVSAARHGRLWRLLHGRVVVSDAEGRLVDLVHPRLWGLEPEVRAELGEGEWRSLRRSTHACRAKRAGLNAVSGLVMAGLVMVVAVTISQGALARGRPIGLISGAVLAIMSLWLLRESWRYASGTGGIDADGLRDALLRANRCPSCVRRLEDDGSGQTCVACGTRWRRPA